MDKNCLPYKYDALCKTDIIESDKYTFVWRISKFSSRTEKTGEVLNSEEFTVMGPDDKITTWYVQLNPRGRNEDSKDQISVFLRKAKPEENVDANLVLSSLDADNVKQKIKELGVSTFESEGWGWKKAIDRKDLSQHTPGDVLTLFFEITILGKTKKSIEFAKREERCLAFTDDYHHTQLANDVASLFLSKDHSDVIIRCGHKVYDCHKTILTSRSPVMKTMLESNMKEKITGDIEIKNMDHEVLEDLLKYIYSGFAPNIEEHAVELFAAADQYQIEKLKELCELKLCSRLDIANCIELLILGDLHSAPKLKAASLEFVSKNMQKMKASEWKKSLIAYPALVLEVMERLLPKNVDENDTTEIKKRAAF